MLLNTPRNVVWISLLATTACAASTTATTPPPASTHSTSPASPSATAAVPAAPVDAGTTPQKQDAKASQEPQAGGDVKWTQEDLERVSRDVMADLEKLRGEKFSRPVAVKVSTKPDLIEYMKQRESKTEPAEKLAADELIAKMLGAVPPDMDMHAQIYALMESQVAGFYDPDTNSFSLMDHLPVPLTKITLSHELDHALDDQLFDIDGTLKKVGEDSDATAAFQAVVEGSGTVAMTQWMLHSKEKIDASMIDEKQMKEFAQMAGAPEWLWKPMMAVYMAGSGFLAKTDSWMTAAAKPLDGAAVRTAFEKPPRSTEQVLHPEKYWDPSKIDEPRHIKFDTSKLDAKWKVLREDTLGELSIGVLTTPLTTRNTTDFSNPMALVTGLSFTNDIASGWGGDRLLLLGNGDARVLRWVSVWDTPRDAGEFYGAMQQQLPALENAAKALSGAQAKDSGASLEYGKQPDEVVITVRVKTSRSDAKRLLRDLEPTVEARP